VHAQDASQFESIICELDELKARPSLLGAFLECPKLKLELDACFLNVKKLETKLLEKSHVSVTSSPCELCVSLEGELGLGYERCEDKGEISTKFVPSSTYKDEEEILKAKQIPYPLNPKPSFNPKRAQKQTTNPSMPNLDGVYTCMFCGHAGYFDEFCFRRKRMEKKHFDYARSSYHDEFFNFLPYSYSRALPRTSSRALSRFFHGPKHRSYNFGL
jgi:hypothetical protein